VRSDVPQELIDFEGHNHTELELFEIAREEGCDIAFVARSSAEDWDRYALNQAAALADIKALADPVQRREQLNWVRHYQDMFVKYRRDLQGWAMYVLIRGLSLGV
jgi:hypothetical protein